MNKTRQRIILILVSVAAIALLAAFFGSILIPLLIRQTQGDYEGARQILADKGVLGLIAVPVIEALQMIVVFIPAEFIQVSSGLALSWQAAVPLCSLGVFLGASAIFLLVRIWNFEVDHGQDTIARMQTGSVNVRLYPFLTLLFFMPVIPFGAICYFGASRKNVRYLPYVLTCTLASLPSVLTSNVMGLGIRLYMAESIPLWLLILIILGGMLLLFLLIFLVLERVYFRPAKGTPDSPWYSLLCRGAGIFSFFVSNYRFRGKLPDGFTGPALYVSNHTSPLDYYAVARMIYPLRVIPIVNEYYIRKGLAKKLLGGIGAIPKKLFTEDPGVALKARRAVKSGWSVYLSAEGRLSADGTPYPILPSTGRFAQFLQVPLVLVTIRGGYLNKPKWRPFFLRQRVDVCLEKIVSPEELKAMTPEQVNDLITRHIAYDDFSYAEENRLVYPSLRKAEGLTGLLYRCPVCGELYALRSAGNRLSCSCCGIRLEIDADYGFKHNPAGIRNIPDAYRRIREAESRSMVPLSCPVTVKRFDGATEETGRGFCRLDAAGFSFTGSVAGEPADFFLPREKLEALPFSCREEFETYWQGKLYYFYPGEHREQCARWGLYGDLYAGKEARHGEETG